MDRNGALSEMQIGAVATRSGLTTDTVRFYEKQGLVANPRAALVDFVSIKRHSKHLI